MSRLVTLVRFPSNIRSTCELPAGFKVEPLGSREQVLSLIGEIFPEAKRSNWYDITLNTQDAHAEMMLDNHDPVESLGLRNPTENVIRAFCKRTDWRAVDAATGDLMNFD
jgi:hypothetical protein